MAELKMNALERKTIEARFDDLFSEGWKFVPVKEEKSLKVKDYNVISPSGNRYSLCPNSEGTSDNCSYIHSDDYTEFDVESEGKGIVSDIRAGEIGVVDELVYLLRDVSFVDRKYYYQKYMKRD